MPEDDTDEIKKVTLNLPKPLWRRIRLLAVQRDMTLTDLLREWLEEALRNKEHQTNQAA